MVARELRTQRLIRVWRDDLIRLPSPPFHTGPDSLVVAYYASAELGCFLALGWPMPSCILDLYPEHRCHTNGAPTGYGNGLLGALASHGLAHIDAGDKERMRRLIMDNSTWRSAEQTEILNYCQSDVDALATLLPHMAPGLDLPRALLRGRYMAAVARMEWTGIPIDIGLHGRLSASWDTVKDRLIADVDQVYGVYEGRTFKADRFAQYLMGEDIPWPRLPSGALALDDNTFRQQARLWPQLEPLQQLRSSLGQLRLNALAVGRDRRGRCLLSPFASVTGRNQPSNSRFVFGPSRWVRGLIRPSERHALAYIDWSSQEIAIAAGLSGDERMIEGYRTGDPYLTFAKEAHLAPAEAT